MTDDLKAWLRAWPGVAEDAFCSAVVGGKMNEAAARIEQLEAALRETRTQLQKVFQAPEHTGKLSWIDDTASALSDARAALGVDRG